MMISLRQILEPRNHARSHTIGNKPFCKAIACTLAVRGMLAMVACWPPSLGGYCSIFSRRIQSVLLCVGCVQVRPSLGDASASEVGLDVHSLPSLGQSLSITASFGNIFAPSSVVA